MVCCWYYDLFKHNSINGWYWKIWLNRLFLYSSLPHLISHGVCRDLVCLALQPFRCVWFYCIPCSVFCRRLTLRSHDWALSFLRSTGHTLLSCCTISKMCLLQGEVCSQSNRKCPHRRRSKWTQTVLNCYRLHLFKKIL